MTLTNEDIDVIKDIGDIEYCINRVVDGLKSFNLMLECYCNEHVFEGPYKGQYTEEDIERVTAPYDAVIRNIDHTIRDLNKIDKKLDKLSLTHELLEKERKEVTE